MRKQLTTPISILLLVSAGLACSMFRRKPALTWRLTLEVESPAGAREAAMKQTIAVLESRLDGLGIPNFEVKPEGDSASGRILLSLPSVADPERIKHIITDEGKLELTHVISPPSPMPVQTYTNKEEAIAALKSNGTIPTNRQVLPYSERSESSDLQGAKSLKWVVAESPAIIDGSELRTAAAIPSRAFDEYQIAFTLKPSGASRFGAWTAANINEYIGVVLDGQVKSIAFIRGQIFDQGEISGRFTRQSAQDLALILKLGSLPAPLKIVEERSDK
jgi:preprotein translocase subunit SecD